MQHNLDLCNGDSDVPKACVGLFLQDRDFFIQTKWTGVPIIFCSFDTGLTSLSFWEKFRVILNMSSVAAQFASAWTLEAWLGRNQPDQK